MPEPASFMRNLYLTSPMLRGGDVAAVQRSLALRGVKLAQDGLYGLASQTAVRNFQAAEGLVQDGVVGRATWAGLFGAARAAAAAVGVEPPARHCFTALTGKGWSPAQACGIIANIKHESRFDPAIVGDRGAAYGLAQWHPPRQEQFRDLKGRPIFGSSIDDQLDFLHHEMTDGDERGAGRRLRAAGTAQEAGEIVSRFYERPRAADEQAELRGRTAELYFQQLTAAGPVVVKPRPPFIEAPDRTAADVLGPRLLRDLVRPHRLFHDGQPWSLAPDGIRLGNEPVRTELEDVARMRAVLARHGPMLTALLSRGQVPIELVLAGIDAAAVQGAGPRHGLGCDLNDPGRTPDRVWSGLMQTALSMARLGLGRPDLPLAELERPDTAIRAGMTVMWLQAVETGFDPPLVAAAYAAGGLHYDPTPSNPWRLAANRPGAPSWIDRFISSFSAAMLVTTGAALPTGVSSFHDLFETATAPALAGSAGPYVAPNPSGWIGKPSVGTGECVPLVQQAAGAPLTKAWRQGAQVQGNPAVEAGTVIATFDANGRYGSRADGQCHAALYLSQSGRGIKVVDQWNKRNASGAIIGKQVPHERDIEFGQPTKSKVNQGESFFVVL